MAIRKKIPLIPTDASLDITGDVSIAGSGSAVITFPSTTSTLATTSDIPTKASSAEINTGTDNDKYITPDALAGSDYEKNPMTTAGDIIYGGTSGVPTRLAKGTATQVLTMNSGATAPEWADASGGGGALQYVEYTLTSENIKSMFTTPVEIMPAPGAGKITIIYQILSKFIYGTIQYTGGNQLLFKTATLEIGKGCTGGAINGTGTEIASCGSFQLPTTISAILLKENEAILAYNKSSAFESGDGIIKLYITYKTITL